MSISIGSDLLNIVMNMVVSVMLGNDMIMFMICMRVLEIYFGVVVVIVFSM